MEFTGGWETSNIGGVGEVLLKRKEPRKLFTDLGDPNLTAASNAFTTENQKITPELLGFAPKDALERERLIQFVHGYDSYTPVREKGKTALKKRKWDPGSHCQFKASGYPL